MFKDKAFSNLRQLEVKGKKIYITDRHQYVLPCWSAHSQERQMSYELVSIDFHPDTNPPFWQVLTLEATLANKEEDQAFFDKILDKKINKIDKRDLDQIIEICDELNNDEHINTAMTLGILKDYHMLNCMDEHLYDRGKHYLIKEGFYGSLEDDMFRSVAFVLPKQPFILDIDLDYFMRRTDFTVTNDDFIRYLVQKSEIITIARSVKYFEYLKKEDFSIETCESLLLELIESYL